MPVQDAIVVRCRENLAAVRDRIAEACGRAGRRPDDVRLVAVTKYVSVDAARAMLEAGCIDLGESIRECLSRRKVEITSRDLGVDCRIEPGEFHSDPVLWRAIVQNLVDNAVAYAPAGSTIGITASPRSLSVSNDAPGLDEDDLGKLFERFWRKEGPRSGTQHSGLGLSIVRSSAEFLGGRCDAMLESGRLNVVVMGRE